jgi:hypothetical protein
VLAHVTHFLPYFYIATPRGFDPNETRALMEHLNVRCIGVSRRTYFDIYSLGSDPGRCCGAD